MGLLKAIDNFLGSLVETGDDFHFWTWKPEVRLLKRKRKYKLVIKK